MIFNFNDFQTNVKIYNDTFDIFEINSNLNNSLVIADENTVSIAKKICADNKTPLCVLKSGEENKNWQSIETILKAAYEEGISRDGVFIAVGGGVICDMAGFASSVYMRGCRLVLVPTTLLCMVDASVGGKTGIDLFDRKNFAGSFYPADSVYMPLDALRTLPKREWKSGMAELLKTAILTGDDDFFDKVTRLCGDSLSAENLTLLSFCIEKAVQYKGGIVTEDPKETKGIRALLNLGHTFGHALESVSGLGTISHGEAVAWGMARACELGLALRITPAERAEKITKALSGMGYCISSSHPSAGGKNTASSLLNAMKSDKKKRNGKLVFIVPDAKSACPVTIDSESDMKILENILASNNN